MALRSMLQRSFNRNDFPSARKLQSTFSVAAKDYIDPDWETAKPYKSIPTPKVLKFYKEFAKGGRYDNLNPTELFTQWREDYGELIRITGMLGRPDIVISFRPEDFEKVFRTEGPWPIRNSSEILSYYREKVRPEVFGELSGLLTTQGEAWQRVRSIVNPVMMQPKIERAYVDKVDAVAREFMDM